MATLVTALYDLGRGSMKKEACNHRPFSQYLDWFKNLLVIDAPLVIFIPPVGSYSGGHDLQAFVKKHRPIGLQTKVIIRDFKDLALWQYREQIASVMQSLPEKEVKSPKIEFHLPDYIITIYSKFDLLKETIESNPFKTEYFFWIDAGFCRQGKLDCKWPDPCKLRSIEDKFIVQNISLKPPEGDSHLLLVGDRPLAREEVAYLKKCANDIITCFFGGLSHTLLDVRTGIMLILSEMLGQGLVNNEQNALSVLIKRMPSRFILYPYHGYQRVLVGDLAINAPEGHPSMWRLGYSICPRLIAFTAATREIQDDKISPWLTTAKYFGYRHKVLGREQKWGGWPFRTRLYLDAVKAAASSVDVVILADSTDLFFCGPAWEAYDKFIARDKPLLIGGENIIAYADNHGRYNSYIMEEFLTTKCKSRFCYPNGGFVIGTPRDIITLLEANIDSTDDQAGYMDLCYEKKTALAIDEETHFIGNIPNLHEYANRDFGFWKLDQPRRRYYNPNSKQYPIALHFPGRNMGPYNLIYQQTMGNVISDDDRPSSWSNWWPWLLLLIVILVFFIGSCWYYVHR